MEPAVVAGGLIGLLIGCAGAIVAGAVGYAEGLKTGYDRATAIMVADLLTFPRLEELERRVPRFPVLNGDDRFRENSVN